MASTIYVITFYELNHNTPGHRDTPLDPRFLDSDRNYVYYLIDEALPEPLRGKRVLFEKQIDPTLYKAGAIHLGEWSFLLAEVKHGFCEYPFFMISSRFYQKNTFLQTDLNVEWETIFNYLQQYGWGFLPSYDRPLGWVDFEWRDPKSFGYRYQFFLHRFTDSAFPLIDELYDVRIPEDYPAMSDLQCNYIGFQSRQHLLDYVGFYQPLIDTFFDEEINPIQDLSRYVRLTNQFRNEKPFTFYLEAFSHLFFFKKRLKAFALHYKGYYEVDERNKAIRRLAKIDVPRSQGFRWSLRWNWHVLKESLYGPYRHLPYPVRQVYRRVKAILAMRRNKATLKTND